MVQYSIISFLLVLCIYSTLMVLRTHNAHNKSILRRTPRQFIMFDTIVVLSLIIIMILTHNSFSLWKNCNRTNWWITSGHWTLKLPLNAATIELMIEQQVANTMATYETNGNTIQEQDRIWNIIHGCNNDIARVCTYEKFIKLPTQIFLRQRRSYRVNSLDRENGIDIPYQFLCRKL